MKATDYTKALIAKQGLIEARRIAEATLNLARSGNITLYSDCEWSMGTKGLEQSKTNRKEGTKAKRESILVKFWTNVVAELRITNKEKI